MEKSKLEIVKDSITQVGVPAMLDEVLEGCEVRPEPYTLDITESGSYSIKAEDVDAEERQEQGLTPWDGLSQVNVTVDVPDTGDITSFEGTVTGSSLAELADFANRCACVGALLSHDNGTFTIWNGDSNAADYWDPQATETSSPSTQYGTVIAVCAGKGLWVAKDGVDAENSYTFAPNGTNLYNYFLKTCVTGTGWDNTQHILTNYYVGNENTYEGTIWKWMKGVESENSVLANHLFIPNAEELRKVCFNTMDDVYTGQQDESETSQSFQHSRNIGVLLGLTYGNFWSSSQSCDDYDGAYYVTFGDGCVCGDGKSGGCYSLALLHF